MNLKWRVTFGILVLIMLISIVYAFVQQTVAEATQREAIAQKIVADEQRVIAEQAKLEATRQAAIAGQQTSLYMQALKECEELKKKRK
jgi:hypothetical protein